MVVAATIVAYSWEAYGHHVFTLTGHTAQGLPAFSPPPTSDTTSNGTIVSFKEIVEVRSSGHLSILFPLLNLTDVLLTCNVCSLCLMQDFGGGLAVIPLMGLLESIAIAKAFGKSFYQTSEQTRPWHSVAFIFIVTP